MGYKIDWIIPGLRRPSRLWYCASTITVAVVGLFSKIIVEWLNKTTVYNRATMIQALECRAPGVPLLTVSNHHSCFDDPGLWGVLDLKVLCSSARMRWSLAAHDICFTNSFHSYFFMFGKCVPVVRGEGVYQNAMDFCLEQLNKGKWVHIFPEGKVNMSKEFLRFKWGVGRLIYDCPIPPVVLPVWHEGMDSVLPNVEPYLLKFRKRVFLNFGDPIQITDLVDSLKKINATPEEARKAITDRIQYELYRLRDQTHALIRQTLGGTAEQFLSRPAAACLNSTDERKNIGEERINSADERINNTDEWINNTKQRINNTEEWINNTKERINNTEEWINNTKERINITEEWINNTKEQMNNKERKENGVDRDTSDSEGKGHLKQS